MSTPVADPPARPTGPLVEAVWREFAAELRTFIARRVARPEDAEDILQLVALRLSQSPVERDRSTLLAWLYTVTRNAITDHYRAAVRRREVTTDDVPEPRETHPAPDEETARALAGLAPCVRPLLRLLPEEQAAALEMVDLGGVSQVDAARESGISVSGMKSRVQRGRRALREALAACCQVHLDARGTVQDVHPHAGTECACATSRG